LIDNNADLLKELENRLQSDMSKLSLETDDTARTLFQCLYELDSSLFSSYYLLETSPFISYLNRLAYCVGPAIAQLHVKNEPNRDVAINRLLLFVAARNVMREGLELLGIKPLSRI
jgi:arginyl-tRNA synthetase